jgi:hypothetical protein
VAGGCIFIHKMSFELGLRINQSHIAIDRAKSFAFALAVENCVNRQVFAATRRPGDAVTEVIALSVPSEVSTQPNQVVQNGSIISVWLTQMFSFDEFATLKIGKGKFVPIVEEPPTSKVAS